MPRSGETKDKGDTASAHLQFPGNVANQHNGGKRSRRKQGV